MAAEAVPDYSAVVEDGEGKSDEGGRPVRQQTTLRQEESKSGQIEAGSSADVRVAFSPDTAMVGRALSLSDGATVIGRDVADGICVEDGRMSRVHSRIVWDAQAKCHRVGDGNSTNGTFLNSKRVESAALNPGDVIRSGDTLFVYGFGDAMKLVATKAKRAATSNLTVLLLGETGSGKEVLARAIHNASGRPGPFVPVNCGGLPRELIASELFGHVKGAFSGAQSSRRGVFAAAEGGTLFLDELGELPLQLQPLLLRAVEQRAIRPVGADHEIPVDVRLIVATNVDLETAAKNGTFREDLYARVAQIVLRVPPLRERRVDVLPLLTEFAKPESTRVTADAAEALLLWHWPYNVRELKSLTEMFTALSLPGAPLELSFLEENCPAMVELLDHPENPPPSRGPSSRRGGVERQALRDALIEAKGNVSAAASALGTTRTQIYRWMKLYGFTAENFRSSDAKG